jgi:programmed cell death protein 5
MNKENVTMDELKRIEQLKKIILRKILTKEAIERLGRIRLVKPQLAAQLELYLVQLYQAGRIKDVITEEKLKSILQSLSTKKRFRIIK